MNKPLAMEPAVVPHLRHALLTHYDRFGRDLPWRESTDPYRVLISEFMLQQTRVATVERYYDAWLERFPDLQSLASAEEDDVLKAWEGMGYYRRARNLRKAAVMIVHEHGGVFQRPTMICPNSQGWEHTPLERLRASRSVRSCLRSTGM